MARFMFGFLLLGTAAVTGCQATRGAQPIKMELDLTYHHDDGEVRLRLRQ
jgi:hypothetical protein